jgi:TRAP-type C4-dicarboxylate transport system permease small subunit
LVLGIVFMLGIGAITTLNVILRLFNIAMAGFMESIEIMMIVAIMGAMSFAVFEKTQIAIDVLVNRFSPGNQRKLEIVALVASCVFWAAIGWATLDWLLRGAYTAITDILKVPMWPFQVYWLLGLLFFCLVYLTELLLLISEKRIKE